MDAHKVDQIIQFSLAVSSQEDDFKDRELGPIHMVKYVYLADMYYYQRKGESFTGANWRFHHFGPWSNEVFQRIEPALNDINAEKKTLPSSFSDDDYYRWCVRDGDIFDRLENALPIIITSALRQSIHQFTNNTTELLHHVYLTEPMLKAAPGEDLEFKISERKIRQVQAVQPTKEELSKKAQKRKRAKLEALREGVRERLARQGEENRKSKDSFIPPRYDEVFSQGVEWLEQLDGEPIKDVSGEVEFSPDIWKSKARYDPDVS